MKTGGQRAGRFDRLGPPDGLLSPAMTASTRPIATCHCGAVNIELPYRPRAVADCNCTICRRYGVLWAYYRTARVRIEALPDALDSYAWGRRVLRFVRCRHCGCVTHWERIVPIAGAKLGINARLLAPAALRGAVVIRLDGLHDRD